MNADAVRVVYYRIPDDPSTLTVVDAHRRTYLGLSTDGTYFHAVRPARLDDPSVGDGLTVVGDLLCSCAGGRYGKQCYWTKLAIALEKGDRGFVLARDPEPKIPWLDAAPGELMEMYGR